MALEIFNSLDEEVIFSAYQPGDSIYAAPLKEFSIPAKTSRTWNSGADYLDPFGAWDRAAGFQLKLKRGPEEVLRPSTTSLFQSDGRMIIERRMEVAPGGHSTVERFIFRPFTLPTFALTTPLANAGLGQSRDGKPDPLVATLDMKDWHVFGIPRSTTDNLATRVTVRFFLRYVSHALEETVDAEPADISSIEQDGIATFRLGHRFKRPGPVEIRAELLSSDPLVTGRSTSTRSAQVLPSLPAQITAEFPGSQTGTGIPTFPAVSSVIQCILSADRDRFLADNHSLRYRFGQGLPTGPWSDATAEPVTNGAAVRRWRLALPIAGSPPFPSGAVGADTMSYTLEVRGKDAFDEEVTRLFAFRLRDVTPPSIDIIRSRTTDQDWSAIRSTGDVYVTGNIAALEIRMAGKVSDEQSGLKAGSLSFSLGGTASPVTVDTLGAWEVSFTPQQYGAFNLRMSAEDNAGNRVIIDHPFEVLSAYLPSTLNEFLSPQWYLRELQRFTMASLTKADGSAVSQQDLETKFGHPFRTLYLPNAPAAMETASDLLVPIRLLRKPSDETRTTLSPLLGRWSFDELAHDTLARDGLIERFDGARPLKLIGRYKDDPNATTNVYGDAAKPLAFKSPDDVDFTFLSGRRNCVEIGEPGPTPGDTRNILRLGKDNRDFSLSLWIHPLDQGAGSWRSVLFKGSDDSSNWVGTARRTPSIWLFPDDNRVYFRVSTDRNRDEGGSSKATLPVSRWSHLAYVKNGRRLSLYIDGQLDTEVRLAGSEILPNDDPLYLGANPWHEGFNGALGEFRIYGLALGPDEVRRLATDRRAGLRTVSPGNQSRQTGADTAIGAFCRTAHAAMLRGLGTSTEELSTLESLAPSEVAALENRLGLVSPSGMPGEALKMLRADDLNDLQSYQVALTERFGIPPTVWDDVTQPLGTGTPSALLFRQLGLEAAWIAEDAGMERWPDLDPDLVEFDELNRTATVWRALHIVRSGELSSKFTALSDVQRTPVELIGEVFTQTERERIASLADDETAGRSIDDGLGELSLDTTMFRRLLVYLRWSGHPLSQEQHHDLGHLLVEVWKRRVKRPLWLQEENRIRSRLWPSTNGEAAWTAGSGRSRFLPWRGSAMRRDALEARLNRRHRDWQVLIQSHTRLVLDVQRETLPILRDDLLGISDLPESSTRLGALAEHLLCDLSVSGSQELTAADQAAASLQVLLNGVRQSWFEAGHPAHDWRINDPGKFDAHWSAVDSLARWRGSVLNTLFPENTLYPELRRKNSTEFKGCIAALRRMQPVTAELLDDRSTDYAQRQIALVDALVTAGASNDPAAAGYAEEVYVFVPLMEGIALQRVGAFRSARERYKRVLDVSIPRAARPYVVLVSDEPIGEPAGGRVLDPSWTEDLGDPHARASKPSTQRNGCANPYTRFVLFQTLRCFLDEAAAAHAEGTVDGLALARSLYLEAEEILSAEELEDVPPTGGGEAHLPNPVLEGLHAETAAGLRKIRNGLSLQGTPLPPDPTRGATTVGLSSLIRPTPYSYRVLVDRAKQLVALAQQFESQYLSALERRDAETEKLYNESFALEFAEKTQTLRDLGVTEATTGKVLAERQQRRSRIEADRYANWLAAGDTGRERQELDGIKRSRTLRQLVNGFQTAASIAQAVAVGADIQFWKAFAAGTQAGAILSAGISQGFLIAQETSNQINSILAGRERREQEWRLRLDLAEQDAKTGITAIQLANDRLAISQQELKIAEAQSAHAQQMLDFARNKFTSAEFYEWLSGELVRTYAFFLQLATSLARQAELQLAFQRQDSVRGFVRADYWRLASADSGKDRRGITGSARLLQDLYDLDQYAFSSEKRLLNLSQSISLSQLMPLEFEEFRRTGVLLFETPMNWFDAGFPGHHLRLIKRVRITIAALIPPSLGVRASLSNNGLSRVVTADYGHPTVIIRQDPQSIALTSPSGATGVFDLDAQSEMLQPFEGSGVDTTWMLEMPPAANPFDFDSLMDVVISIDYTALSSPALRERVVKSLPREATGQRVYSLRRDLPDIWYASVNDRADRAVVIPLTLGPQQFPPGIDEVSIEHLAVSARRVDGVACAFRVAPSVVRGTTKVDSQAAVAVGGLVSSRQSAALDWRRLQGPAVGSRWSLLLSDDGLSPGFLDELRRGEVEDIYLVLSYRGLRPRWREG